MNTIDIRGRILFEPENKTKKHESQATWKRMAMVMIDGDISAYYSWFLWKRYAIKLNPPLRGSHVSFINDSIQDMQRGLNKTLIETEKIWTQTKAKWDGKELELTLSIIPHYGAQHWWLILPHDKRSGLHDIRAELGLKPPYFGLHMTLGYVNEKYVEHNKYIQEILKYYNAIND